MAATKASPATEEPVKRTATKASPAKRTTADPKAAKAAPAKRAAKAAAPAAKAPAKRAAKATAEGAAPRTRAKKAAPAGEDAVADDGLETGPDQMDSEPTDLEDDAELEDDLEDLEDESDSEGTEAAPEAGVATPAAKAKDGEAKDGDDEDVSEPSDKDKASGDFVWDEEESEALRQARKDAELTASADSVRAYLKQIGKVALLNAEEEVELAKRIEAGLYATQLMTEVTEKGEKLPAAQRRDMQWI